MFLCDCPVTAGDGTAPCSLQEDVPIMSTLSGLQGPTLVGSRIPPKCTTCTWQKPCCSSKRWYSPRLHSLPPHLHRHVQWLQQGDPRLPLFVQERLHQQQAGP
ncbi:hypothetical protein P7K49_037913 [Saguinus oedipus]|uniref:Uncharacterized protein n=1 Tax=Saguinus oedipus TaxID=9490 RepID=A0ABQ9TD52_SAGOE|nr:hypothetical protein P7K49_037913 [Saguinus oedipus]